jgi:hypothetical protein
VPEQSVTVHTAEPSAEGENTSHDRLSEQIATLPSLNKAQLLAIWAENFSKDPPPNLRKELMVPILAYRMQEREFGGLSHGARRRPREVAASLNTEKPSQERPDSAPQIAAAIPQPNMPVLAISTHCELRWNRPTELVSASSFRAPSTQRLERTRCWPAAHVADVARLYLLALEKGTAGARYHAVAEEGVALKDIATCLGASPEQSLGT